MTWKCCLDMKTVIAMGNGEEKAKNAQEFITLDNDSDGIIYGLSRYLDII